MDWWTREVRYANGVCVKTKFPETGNIDARPGTREYKRQVRRAEKNASDAARELAGALNQNWVAGKDCHVLLTYDEEGMDKLIMRAGTDDPDEILVQAKKEIKNAVRRVGRILGEGVRYAYVTADTDGDTGELVRVHHHVVCDPNVATAFSLRWGNGEVKIRTLYALHYGDLSDLAEYMVAQVRRMGTEKRYTVSRNLSKPEVRPLRKAKNPDAELTMPRNARFIHRSGASVGRPQNLRYYREEFDKRKVRLNE